MLPNLFMYGFVAIENEDSKKDRTYWELDRIYEHL